MNHCVGSSNTSTRIQRILSKLAPFTVTGITSTYYGRIQNFRLHTLGVPVSTSDSQEASRSSLRSSKLELKTFHRDACIWHLNIYIGSSNVISRILRTFSKFSSLLSSKRVRPKAFGGSEFGFGAVNGESRLQSSRVRTGQATNGNNKGKKRTQMKMTRKPSKDGE